MHKVNITIPRVIFCEGDEILIPPCVWTLKGPHTSICTNSKHSLAPTPLEVKGLLVILPFIQDLDIIILIKLMSVML